MADANQCSLIAEMEWDQGYPAADDRLQAAAAANPSGRALDFEDVTASIAFFTSTEASMIQGRVYFFDGGLYL